MVKIYRLTEFLWGGGVVNMIVSAPSPEKAKKVASVYELIRRDLNYYTKNFNTVFDNSNIIELGIYNKDIAEVIFYNLEYSNCY